MSKAGILGDNRIHSILWKIVTVAWAALIFRLSTSAYGPSFSIGLVRVILDSVHIAVSPASFETMHHLLRKLAHPAEYAVFAMLMYGSFRDPQPFAWRPRRALWCFLFAALYSLTDEFHQRFVPGRTPALADCGIDSLGGAIGMFVYYVDHLLSQGSCIRSGVRPLSKTPVLRWLSSKLGFVAR